MSKCNNLKELGKCYNLTGLQIIEIAEKQLNNRWILVSEELPRFTGDYNVTVGVGTELGYFEEVRTYRYEIFNGKYPYGKWVILNKTDEVINVLAWQSLPELYKEEEE